MTSFRYVAKNFIFKQTKTSLFFFTSLIFLFSLASCKKSEPFLSTNLIARDPSIIFSNGTYYLFGTGPGISEWSSTDLQTWVQEPAVFNVLPSWINAGIPGVSSGIWAPDISYFQGQYYLFYAISQFGTNNSDIGLATNVTLNKNDSSYNWVDRGKILSSNGTAYNAIDPNFVTDFTGEPYLVFGSFFNGIHLAAFQSKTFQIQSLNNLSTAIASRDSLQAINAIEAPFIFRHNGNYYLFASIGTCCEGTRSTYQTIVGRAPVVSGPYKDSKGMAMTNGGGDILLSGDKDWHGAGGGSVYEVNGEDIIVYFSYDGYANNRIRIAKLLWNDAGWPTAQKVY